MTLSPSVRLTEKACWRNLQSVIRLLLILVFGLSSMAHAEHVVLSGGPALQGHEGYRVSRDIHDKWWANFIRSATIRLAQIRDEEKSQQGVTWMVYKKGYAKRGYEDGKPYTTYIQDLAKKYGAKLVWIDSARQVYATMNKFAQGGNKITSFDYFGHSNKFAFMLDYSCDIMGTSTVWIHESELGMINPDAFHAYAKCNSYGCYTADLMSDSWKRALGVSLFGCTGKTDYSYISFGKLPKPSSGRWTD